MLDNYRDLIDELLGTPTALRELADRSDQPLPAEAARLIGELRDRDRLVLQRLQTFTRETNPHLRDLQLPEVSLPDDNETLLSEFDTARGELVSLLMNLTLKDWERTAAHGDEGEIALVDEVERHVEFDENQMGRLRELSR
jgi:hypothetical protein